MRQEVRTFRRTPAIAPRASETRCFTVVVDGRVFGLPVDQILTIFEMVAITPVPLARPEILGLVNLRGNIVTAVSLRRRLNRDPSTRETSSLAVALEHRGESFALVVDEVGDVMSLDPKSEIELPPHVETEDLNIASLYRLDALILPILDLDWIFSFDNKD